MEAFSLQHWGTRELPGVFRRISLPLYNFACQAGRGFL